MSKDIKVTGALVFPENVPTRAGEVVNSIGEIYDIPAPRVGMIVYDKSTGINYIVRSLKAKVIDGVQVDNAQVDEYEELDKEVFDAIANETLRAKKEEFGIDYKSEDIIDSIGARIISKKHIIHREVGKSYTQLVYIGNLPAQQYKSRFFLYDLINDDVTINLCNKYGDVIVNLGTILSEEAEIEVTFNIENSFDAWLSVNLPIAQKGYSVDLYCTLIPKNTILDIINDEITRAGEAERSLDDKITAETQRAKNAEQANRQLIADLVGESPETLDTIHEISSWILNDKTGAAAMAKEINENRNNIDINKNNIANNSIAIGDEEYRAVKAEETLRKNIDNTNKVVGIEEKGRLIVSIGVVFEDGSTYPTYHSAYTNAFEGGDIAVTNDGYYINEVRKVSADGVAEMVAVGSRRLRTEKGYTYQLNISKDTNGAFSNDELEGIVGLYNYEGGDTSELEDAIKVNWDANSNMNNFKTAGIYDIYGERTRQDDNLPILNASSGHSIAARLTVVASTLQPANNEICVTQFLMLSNRQGGDGNMYIRTYNENNSPFADWWTPWQKLQGVREGYIFTDEDQVNPDGGVQTLVGTTGLYNMIDNGIYSGIYTDDYTFQAPTFIETFTLIVINNYAVASKDSRLKRTISQLKYAVDAVTNQASVKQRTKTDGSDWTDWTDIGGGGSQEVDITDAVNQYGLYTLYSQGFMKDNVVYKYQQTAGELPQFDNKDSIRPFLVSKGYRDGDTAITITIKKFNSIVTLDVDMCINLGVGGNNALNHYKFITATLSTVKVSADMTEL